MSHRRRAGRGLASIVLLTVVAVAAAGPAGAATRAIKEFKIVTANSQPGDLTVGSDGNVWFVDQNTNKIGRITKTGAIAGHLVPTPASKPTGITTGSDGAIWFTEMAKNKIGRTVTGSTFGQFTIPTATSSPRGITEGPDGNLYFVEFNAHTVNKILVGAPHTISTVATLPAGSGPVRIATGPDGNLWVTESTSHSVARVALPGGAVTQVALPGGAAPSRIAAGPDGNMWAAEPGINKVAQISTGAALLNNFTVLGKPTGIAAGADGNMWVTEQLGNKIARVTPAGVVKEFAIPTKASSPGGISLGADGNIWFSENAGDRIGQLADAAGHSSYVVVNDHGYAPATQGIPLTTGSTPKPVTVRWLFLGASPHTVTDATAMNLFDSGSQGIATTFSHTFTSAGRFAYHSTVGGAMNGTITVTPKGVKSGTDIVITVATTVVAGVTTDVQVKTPGAGGFVSAGSSGGTTLTYTPSNGPGTYRFQVRTAKGGATSDWSPTITVNF